MAKKAPKKSAPASPSLRYLDSVRRTATTFWNDEGDNWNRIWGRIQQDDYTFGKWVHDALQTWDGWMYGATRMASLPSRQFQKVVPTLALVTDIQAESGPEGEVPAPDDFEYGNAKSVTPTPFTDPAIDGVLTIQSTGDASRRTVVVKVVAKPDLAGAKRKVGDVSGGLGDHHGSAMIYQGSKVIARVDLYFKP